MYENHVFFVVLLTIGRILVKFLRTISAKVGLEDNVQRGPRVLCCIKVFLLVDMSVRVIASVGKIGLFVAAEIVVGFILNAPFVIHLIIVQNSVRNLCANIGLEANV